MQPRFVDLLSLRGIGSNYKAREGVAAMKRPAIVMAFVLGIASLTLAASPADAIVNGQVDGNLHPNVGALVAEYVQPGEKDALCSRALIAPKVFLTAAHCTVILASLGITDVWVTFDPQFTASSNLIHGSYVTNPAYNGYAGAGGSADPHDLAVVLLDKAAKGITPTLLPTSGLLDSTNLSSQTFTAVGYGFASRPTGPILSDTTRQYAEQSFLSPEPSWLNLSMNPSTGSGGACFGDPGGPHFLGGPTSNLGVSITVGGDAVCRATDKTYRLDTASARSFLGQYVALP